MHEKFNIFFEVGEMRDTTVARILWHLQHFKTIFSFERELEGFPRMNVYRDARYLLRFITQ